MVSVIVPAYNAEKYLCRCIESILGQTYQELELILVNDGSTDRTKEICDEYALRDTRVVVIHKNNAGVSAARNSALDVATGDYVFFVDADDYIKPDAFSKMLAMQKKYAVDVVYCPHENEKIVFEQNIVLHANDVIKAMLEYRLGWAVWHCLYVKSVWDNVRFDVECAYGEDTCALLDVLMNNMQVLYFTEKIYCYNEESEGSGTRKGKSLKHMKSVVIYLKKIYYMGKCNSEIEDAANYFVSTEWLRSVEECVENHTISLKDLFQVCKEMHFYWTGAMQGLKQTQRYRLFKRMTKMKWVLYYKLPKVVICCTHIMSVYRRS